jgi:hypothetical protein
MMHESTDTRVDEHINEAAKNPKQKGTNKFVDKDQEDAFQAWSFRFSVQARLAVGMIIILHGSFTLLTWIVFSDLDVGSENTNSYPYAEFYRWCYLVPALPFVFVPRSHLDRRMVAAVVEKIGKMNKQERDSMSTQQIGFKKVLQHTSKIITQVKLVDLPLVGKSTMKSIHQSVKARGQSAMKAITKVNMAQVSRILSQKVALGSLVNTMPATVVPVWKT